MEEFSYAPIDNIKFDIEIQLENQLILRPNFAPGLDKPGKPYCNLFSKKMCHRDALCPLKHFRFEKIYVCRHWLRGMCRKGDDCESYHEYDDKKMPQCYFYQKYGHCSNNECPFIHAEMESLQRPCPYYMRGFCSSGPNCKFKHVKLSICPRYFAGFCPQGPHCDLGHPKFEMISFAEIQSQRQAMLVCHACNEPGHKSTACPLVQMYKEKARLEGNTELANLPAGKRPLELVTCFKCRARGHYANKCPYSSSEVAKRMQSTITTE